MAVLNYVVRRWLDIAFFIVAGLFSIGYFVQILTKPFLIGLGLTTVIGGYFVWKAYEEWKVEKKIWKNWVNLAAFLAMALLSFSIFSDWLTIKFGSISAATVVGFYLLYKAFEKYRNK